MILLRCIRQTRRRTGEVRAGFSVLEVVLVVAALSAATAAAILGFNNIISVAETTKLQRDVAVINRAIRTYMIHGGTFLTSDLRDAATVMAKLKTRATTGSAKQLAGLRHSMTDERLSFELQSTSDAHEGAERACFVPDPLNPRFVIQNDGPPGIRRFVLDADLAERDFGSEERAVSLKLAGTDSWVWDYTEFSGRRDVPSLPPETDVNATNPLPRDAGNLPLNPPGFSIATGNYPLWTYPKTVALLPTNPAGAAEFLYSVDSAPFVRYDGPISVLPGMTVTGISVTMDPDRYDDSAGSSQEYTTEPVTLLPAVTFSKSGYNYFELGGEAAPGTAAPLPAGAVNGSGVIENLSQVPGIWQNSEVFRYVWTVDGSDPLISGTAQSQPDFSGGFVPPSLPLPLGAFGASPAVSVRGAVKGVNDAFVSNSIVSQVTLTAVPLALRSPAISITGSVVTLTLDLSGRDIPANTRIFYTTDGTDPGNVDGEPVPGAVEYSAAFDLNPENNVVLPVVVAARLYPPSPYKHWFTTSVPATITYDPPTLGGIDLCGLAGKYLFFFANGAQDVNWQGATKGYAGDVLVDGILAAERTSGGVPYAGTIYTNDLSLGAWQGVVDQNPGQAAGSMANAGLVAAMKEKLNAAFTQINALPVTSGYASRLSTSLHGLNTKNGTTETFVMNITSGFSISSKIQITGDAGDVFILRWDTDANFANGYHGLVKFQSGGGIVPLGGLTPGNFIHVAGDLGSSGGGSNPPSPYPQGPRLNNGTGALISGGSDFAGGGFFTGYWLTTGGPSNGETQSLSNAIFAGGWYTLSRKISMTSGTSGVHVAPNSQCCPSERPGG